MRKNIFLISFLVLIVALLSISCSPKISEPEPEEEAFVANIPECFWGNWIVDEEDYVNRMHFDIDQHHIYCWVEHWEDDIHDCVLPFKGTTEKMYDPIIYKPLFGDIGYEQNYLQISDKHSFSSSLFLQYDSLTDRARLKIIHIDKYDRVKEYTHYLVRSE